MLDSKSLFSNGRKNILGLRTVATKKKVPIPTTCPQLQPSSNQGFQGSVD